MYVSPIGIYEKNCKTIFLETYKLLRANIEFFKDFRRRYAWRRRRTTFGVLEYRFGEVFAYLAMVKNQGGLLGKFV